MACSKKRPKPDARAHFMEDDTIAAIATPPGMGGIAIVRISGPRAIAVADRVFGGRTPLADKPANTVSVGPVHGSDGRALDVALWLVRRAPRSFTGEDLVEIQCHGGAQVPRLVLSAVCAAGARIAEPGEYTRRAFLNGRIDLLQAESVLDIIRAQTDRAAVAAAEQMQGALSKEIQAVYDDILAALTSVEYSNEFTEFTDDQDVVSPPLDLISAALTRAERLLSTELAGRRLRDGTKVVILGPPNSGKSTLFNALLGYDRAIVTEEPGTTRDTIEEQIIIRGQLFRVVDTAGVRSAEGKVEAEGIRRTIEQIETSDVVLHVIDATTGFSEKSLSLIKSIRNSFVINVLNKCDLRISDGIGVPQDAVRISALSGMGLDKLRETIIERLERGGPQKEANQFYISERHSVLLREVESHLIQARDIIASDREDWASLVATHLRAALDASGGITGRTYYPELLDSIFKNFCVGK